MEKNCKVSAVLLFLNIRVSIFVFNFFKFFKTLFIYSNQHFHVCDYVKKCAS